MSRRGRTRRWGSCPATRWTQLTAVGSCRCQEDVSIPGFKTKQVSAGVGKRLRKPRLTEAGPGWAPATGQGPRGTPGHRRSCTQKSIAQHGAGNPFLSLFPKSRLKSNRKPDGGKAHALGFGGWMLFFSLQGLKRQQSDAWDSAGSKREGPSEGRLAGPARLRLRDSTPRSLPPLPGGPLAPGRFNGVIYSRERPLSGPAK